MKIGRTLDGRVALMGVRWGAWFEFKPQDAWIGAFWRHNASGFSDLWICVLPCLPLHVCWWAKP